MDGVRCLLLTQSGHSSSCPKGTRCRSQVFCLLIEPRTETGETYERNYGWGFPHGCKCHARFDPVGQGFISNLARPGKNITGFSFIEPQIVGKWINLLSAVKPDLARVALMFNPKTAPYYDGYLQSLRGLPQQSSIPVNASHVQSAPEVDSAVAELAREPGSGLITPGDPYILAARGAILKAAGQHRLPIISAYRQFVVEGALMSYGPDTADIFRRSSAYVDRILKGEPAGNLPAQSPDKFELVINLKTAKALGLSVRDSFLQLADEVIE